MKIEPGQIWVKNYSPDYHYFPVKVRILEVDEEKIVSEVIYSTVPMMRPVGTILTAPLNRADPIEYKKRFGWAQELLN